MKEVTTNFYGLLKSDKKQEPNGAGEDWVERLCCDRIELPEGNEDTS